MIVLVVGATLPAADHTKAALSSTYLLKYFVIFSIALTTTDRRIHAEHTAVLLYKDIRGM